MNFHGARFDWNEEFEESCDNESKPDADSVFSDGEDLKTDFEDALSGNFKFSGNYFHCHTDSCSPNPGLKIDGVGTIGLPLSERDAEAIISLATPIHVSEEEEEVEGVWEIEAANVDFQNANWESYLATNAILTACKTLGVGQLSHVKPQCELDKVVLLGASESQFILNQEGFHENGFFATVAVVLSSSFEGGQLHISHGEQEALIDVSENSAFSTSIIAWYNEAALKILPVTSGYRLALMYKLIHHCSDLPQPSLHHPSINPSDILPDIFRRWKEGKYRQMPSSKVLACPLSNNYRELDLKHGVSILQGSDADKVERILPIAEKFGFTVCLANLESDYTSPLKADWESYSVFNLVSLTADRKPYFDSIDIYDDSIVLDKGSVPHLSESGRPSQRTVLLIFRNEDEPHLTITSQSIDQTLRKIKLNPQTSTAKEIAYGLLPILQPMKSDVEDPRTVAFALAARDLMDLAVEWDEVDLWIGAFPYSDGPVKHTCGELRKALQVFDVKSLHPSITDLLRRTPQLQSRIRIIEVVVPYFPDQAGPKWADTAMGFVLSIYEEANVEDIPILLELARRRFGLGFIRNSVIPNILHQPQSIMCSFFAALAGELYQNRSCYFPSTTSTSHAVRPSVEGVIRQAVNAAISSSGLTIPQRDPRYLDLDGIFGMVDLCFSVNDLGSTIPLFNAILQSTAGLDTAESFDQVYTPVLSQVKFILHKYGCKATHDPLGTFLQNIISLYLTNIFQSPTDTDCEAPEWTDNKIGCGCDDCVLLDAFINNPAKLQSPFKMREDRRKHLESRIDAFASSFLSYWTMKSGSPYTLHVSKREEALKENVKKRKRDKAFEFLKSVGSDGSLDEAERVMGKRWDDVLDACEGKATFQPSLGSWVVKVEENVNANVVTAIATNAVVKQEVKEEWD